MKMNVEVKEISGSACGKVLGLGHDDYISLVDIVQDFAVSEPTELKAAYEETKNNVMRRFDVDEAKADEYINMVCYGLTLHTLVGLSQSIPPAQVASFTPDTAIINMARAAGAMAVIRNADSEDLSSDKHKEYTDAVKKLCTELGLPDDIPAIAQKQVPQLMMLLALYPPFALGIIDEEFIVKKLMQHAAESNVSPIVTKSNMQMVFIVGAATDKARDLREEDED